MTEVPRLSRPPLRRPQPGGVRGLGDRGRVDVELRDRDHGCVRAAGLARPAAAVCASPPSAVGPQTCDPTLEEGRGRRDATHDAFGAIGTTLPEKVGGISRKVPYP